MVAAAGIQHSALADDRDARRGKIFTISNEPNNELLVYTSSSRGDDDGGDRNRGLRLVAALPTGGQGTGAGLG